MSLRRIAGLRQNLLRRNDSDRAGPRAGRLERAQSNPDDVPRWRRSERIRPFPAV